MIFYDLRIQRAAGFQEQKPCRSNVTSNFSLLTPHNIRTGFIGQKVGDASELLRYGAGPHHRSWDLGVSLDHPAENHFSHIQVHAQAVTKKKNRASGSLTAPGAVGVTRKASDAPYGHDVGEKKQEAEDLEVPTSSKVLESHHDQRHHYQSSEQDLCQAVHLQVKQAHL